MVYTSPTKVTQIVALKKLSMDNKDIAQRIGIHHTTVTCILKCFEKSAYPYYIKPKTGWPHKLDAHNI